MKLDHLIIAWVAQLNLDASRHRGPAARAARSRVAS
jgi:hypothetical protein